MNGYTIEIRAMGPSLKTRPCIVFQHPEARAALVLQEMYFSRSTSRSVYSGEDFLTQASSWSSRWFLICQTIYDWNGIIVLPTVKVF